MTGSTTQATLDAVDLLAGVAPDQAPAVRTRFSRMAMSILLFAAGCAVAALLYWLWGFWCLAVPVVIGAAAAVMRRQTSMNPASRRCFPTLLPVP